jgi:hypothetical protein
MMCYYCADVWWIEVGFNSMGSSKYSAIANVEKYEQHASASEKCPHLCLRTHIHRVPLPLQGPMIPLYQSFYFHHIHLDKFLRNQMPDSFCFDYYSSA